MGGLGAWPLPSALSFLAEATGVSETSNKIKAKPTISNLLANLLIFPLPSGSVAAFGYATGLDTAAH